MERRYFAVFAAATAGDEFSFSRTGSSDGLSFRLVGNGGARENERVPGGGVALAEIIRMSSIHESNEIKKVIRRESR